MGVHKSMSKQCHFTPSLSDLQVNLAHHCTSVGTHIELTVLAQLLQLFHGRQFWSNHVLTLKVDEYPVRTAELVRHSCAPTRQS